MGLLAALFAKRPPPLTPEQRAERELSRSQVEAGGLPVGAERRLRELSAGAEGFFTSDLSVNGFALLHREGIEPLTQVMGSSVFSHPRGRNALWCNQYRSQAHRVQEVTPLTDAFNGARERALSRLRQEAELAGADAVVGVRIGNGGHDWSSGTMNEFVALGTAVRLPPALRTGSPVITDLTAQEYWQLARAGYRPVGVVAISAVTYVSSSWEQNNVLTSNVFWSAAARANRELGEFTHGYSVTRRRAMEDVTRQARAMGAHGVVGVTVEQHLEEQEWEDSSDNRRFDLLVALHLLGTAITEGHEPLSRVDPVTIIPLRQPAAR
ncbi:MAG: hypothetical protein JWP17_2658 [Solirubrobacterales bacterium]|jgi:uncharacterized protein YbjQ (UPF0145 family)|nr:hypothetical protein [Solirubrobacterales bacterium]